MVKKVETQRIRRKSINKKNKSKKAIRKNVISKNKKGSRSKNRSRSKNGGNSLMVQLETSSERLGNFIKTTCPDGGFCLGLGIESEKINAYFKNYNFEYMIKPITLISKGNNGFVNEVIYSRNDYQVSTILKSSLVANARSTRHDGDNLYYEAFVGFTTTNKYSYKYPCFIETYNMYNSTWDLNNKLKYNSESCTKRDLVEGLAKISYQGLGMTEFIRQSCKNKYVSLSVQNVPNAISLYDFVRQIELDSVEIYDSILCTMLCQVYFVLSSLGDKFTHYDLHNQNVLIYQFSNDTYINMNYHYSDGKTISFPTLSIVKMIDYGRCYTPETETYYNAVCRLTECYDKNDKMDVCGSTKGYTYFDNVQQYSNHYISQKMPNVSHDLRLSVLEPYINPTIFNQMNIMGPILSRVCYDGQYGTPSIKKDMEPTDGRIYNIFQMANKLEETVETHPGIMAYKNKINDIGLTCIGDLHIYMDSNKDMKFIPSS